eukprot:4633396-Amphidinium_carterae.1
MVMAMHESMAAMISQFAVAGMGATVPRNVTQPPPEPLNSTLPYSGGDVPTANTAMLARWKDTPVAISSLMSFAAVPGDGDCLWHAAYVNQSGHHTALLQQSLAMKDAVITKAIEFVDQTAVLWGISVEAAREALAELKPSGAWGDARCMLLLAYQFGVNVALWDAPSAELQ